MSHFSISANLVGNSGMTAFKNDLLRCLGQTDYS